MKVSDFIRDTPKTTALFPFVDLTALPATRNRCATLENIFDAWEENVDFSRYVAEDEPNTFSANQATGIVNLTEAPTIEVDGAEGNYFRLLLTQSNNLLSAPAPLRPGPYIFSLKQNNIGGNILLFAPEYKFQADADRSLTLAPNAEDVLSCIYDGWSLKCFLAKGFEP